MMQTLQRVIQKHNTEEDKPGNRVCAVDFHLLRMKNRTLVVEIRIFQVEYYAFVIEELMYTTGRKYLH